VCLGPPCKVKKSVRTVCFSQLMRLLDHCAASSKKWNHDENNTDVALIVLLHMFDRCCSLKMVKTNVELDAKTLKVRINS
jgi:hypothetical protein